MASGVTHLLSTPGVLSSLDSGPSGFLRKTQLYGLRADSVLELSAPSWLFLPVPVTSRLGLMLGCGPGGILGGILLVLVLLRACELMGDIMVVTTGLWAYHLGGQPLCPLLWAASLSAGA